MVAISSYDLVKVMKHVFPNGFEGVATDPKTAQVKFAVPSARRIIQVRAMTVPDKATEMEYASNYFLAPLVRSRTEPEGGKIHRETIPQKIKITRFFITALFF